MAKEKIPSTPAVLVLKKSAATFTLQTYAYEEHGGTRVSSRKLGVDEHCVIKTLVMEDENANPFMILMHGDREVSTKALARALGVTRLMKLVPDHRAQVWDFCLPLLLVITLSAPAGWAAHDLFFPWLRDYLPAWLPISALRPIVYLTCGIAAMAVAWLLLGVLPRKLRASCRSQLSLATCSTAVLGTMLICANQNYTILQSVAFALGSGLGYVFAVFIVREGRRRLRSKAISSIFQGLPSSMIYIGVLSLAIYALVGHTVVL